MSFEVGITVLRQYDILYECMNHVRNSTVRPDRIWVVDNGQQMIELKNANEFVIIPPRNLGVAASWNLLMSVIHPRTAIILNDDCMVAPDTFEKMMAIPKPGLVLGHGFACFRQDMNITQIVGWYDEQFYPAYYEDADYQMRCKRLGVPITDLSSIVKSHGNHGDRPYQGFTPEQKVEFDFQVEANKRYFIRKWGGLPSEVGV